MSETPQAYEAEELQAEKEMLIEENDQLRKDNDNLARQKLLWQAEMLEKLLAAGDGSNWSPHQIEELVAIWGKKAEGGE
jgi:alcohol dehydrogenase YqhD (iron-dependent ADH family)